MHRNTREKLMLTLVGWLVAAVIFFPIFWMVLTSFKTEIEAVSHAAAAVLRADARELRHGPASAPTTSTSRSNSVIISFGATLLAIAASRSRRPTRWPSSRSKRTKDLLLWMLSTKMMPAVGVLVPMYLIFRDLGAARHPHRPDHRLSR